MAEPAKAGIIRRDDNMSNKVTIAPELAAIGITDKTPTLNGGYILGAGLYAATRRGFGRSEILGYGLGIMTATVKQSQEGGVKIAKAYKGLAQHLRGGVEATEALDEYTKRTLDEDAALRLLQRFSAKFGVSILDDERAKIAKLSDKPAEKAKKQGKTDAEKLAAVVTKIEPAARARLLVEHLGNIDGLGYDLADLKARVVEFATGKQVRIVTADERIATARREIEASYKAQLEAANRATASAKAETEKLRGIVARKTEELENMTRKAQELDKALKKALKK